MNQWFQVSQLLKYNGNTVIKQRFFKTILWWKCGHQSRSNEISIKWKKLKSFVTCKIWYFELQTFSFNSYGYHLTRCFIASTRAFSRLPNSWIWTRNSLILTSNSWIWTRNSQIWTRNSHIWTRNSQLVTRVLFFHRVTDDKKYYDVALATEDWLYLLV